MKFVALVLIFGSASVFAGELKLRCVGQYNYQTVLDTRLGLPDSARNVAVGTVGEYEVLLSSLGEGRIELQLYNPQVPSRSYATARAAVELALWHREHLVEVKCR
jgi:hypothetical protein